MDSQLKEDLLYYETDLDGALERFADDEDLYYSCLVDFLNDNTVENLVLAIKQKDWDAAFTAAHALKGMAGNMGFIPLYHASAAIVVKLRSGKISELPASLTEITSTTKHIIDTIRKYTTEDK